MHAPPWGAHINKFPPGGIAIRAGFYREIPPEEGKRGIFCDYVLYCVFYFREKSITRKRKFAMEINLLVKQLFQMSPQRSKNQGSSHESGGTCVCERIQPWDAACHYRTDPFTAAFAGVQD